MSETKCNHLLIDGRNLLHRVRAVTAKRYVEIGGKQFAAGLASYFVKSITLLYQDLAAKDCTATVCWDGEREHLVRRKWFAGYKASRETSAEFADDERSTRAILRVLGIRQAWAPGWEGDDVLATLATEAEGVVGILSADHDILQLHSDRIQIHDPNKKQGKWEVRPHQWTTEEIVAKYTVGPERIPEYKALVGDVSDEIPGIGNIGPMRAQQILAKCPTFIDMIRKPHIEADPMLAKYLSGKAELLKLNLRLCTLRRDVEIKEHWKRSELDLEDILKEFRMMPLLPKPHQRVLRAIQKQ